MKIDIYYTPAHYFVNKIVSVRKKKSNYYTVLGEGNDTPLQYFCLENPTDGEAWWDTVDGVAKSRTRLSDSTSLYSAIPVNRQFSVDAST